jgi:hypothetical protein
MVSAAGLEPVPDFPDPLLGSRLKRLNYLTHRWIGIVLGLLVFVWFGSGIVMMYYPYPELTESQQLALLPAFEPDRRVVGFARAVASYRQTIATPVRSGASAPAAVFYGGGAVADQQGTVDQVDGGRLEVWDGHLAYTLWRERGRRREHVALVDALSARVLTPIDAPTAVGVARGVVGAQTPLEDVALLPRSDHYFMGAEYRFAFPVYRVRFSDEAATAVYVSRNSAAAPAVVTRVTRVTTWLGTVPHWLYFMWLYYDYPGAWEWVNLILPGVAVGLALTGMILGVYQLFPRRHRGEWRVSGYHGMSLWHHVTGIAFGVLVLTWALSGLLEILGASADPRPGQTERARGGSVTWTNIRVGEVAALASLRAATGGVVIPRAIDVDQLDQRPGYRFLLADGRTYWVDAETRAPRGELGPERVGELAERILGRAARVLGVDEITHYDAYYYARHGREKHLPAWRVRFDDADHSVLYLDTVSGTPVGFVDDEARRWRWWRDGLHDLDLPALINHRPWWDFVVLPLMIGGTISAITGVWLLCRRLRRMGVL